MKEKDCLDALVPHESAIEALAQRVVDVLSAPEDSLKKVKEIQITINPVVVYTLELKIIP